MRPLSIVAFLAVACTGEVVDLGPPVQSSAALVAPPHVGFRDVADALQPSCGTLDCHGQIGRNLRLYGARGLRLAPGDTSAEGATTDAEYEATYWSLVGLEPETMTAVLRDHGADPERLSLVRMGRGVERHKGGKVMTPGDHLDTCLLSWLAGSVDQAACQAVVNAMRPMPSP